MIRLPVLMVSMCLLSLGGRAWAVDFTDQAAGNWSSDAVWTPSGGPPLAPSDTAAVISYAVTIDTDLPPVAAITVGSRSDTVKGTLILDGGTEVNVPDPWNPPEIWYTVWTQTSAQTVTVGAGGTLQFNGIYRGYRDAPNWTVHMNDGSTFHLDDQRSGVHAHFVIGADATALFENHGGWSDAGGAYAGVLESPSSGTLRFNSIGYVASNSGVSVSVDNPNLLGKVVLDKVWMSLNSGAGLGPAESSPGVRAAPIEMRNGCVLNLARGYEAGALTYVRDLAFYAGTLRMSSHGMYWPGNNWSGNLALHGDINIEVWTQEDQRGGNMLSGLISEDATPRALNYSTNGWDTVYTPDGKLYLTNAGNSFSGGLNITTGMCYVTAPGAQGAGPVTLKSGGKLLLQAAAPADWTLKNNLGGDGIIRVEDGSGSYKLTAQGSTVAPGNSAGTLTVQGGFAFAKNGLKNAKLSIELVGVTAGDPPVFSVQNDQLAVTGDVTGLANANLEVGLFNLTVADLAGKTFTILTCGNDLSGGGDRFASVVYPSMAGAGLGGPISYNNGSIDIQVTYLGDADMSGTVTFTDYQMLEASFGVTTGATWAMGDFDGDGDVDFTDYQILESNFGSPVPEPATLALLAVGAAGLIRRR